MEQNPLRKNVGKSISTSSTSAKPINKQKLLIIASRGIISRYRHLMKDLLDLLPHAKKGI